MGEIVRGRWPLVLCIVLACGCARIPAAGGGTGGESQAVVPAPEHARAQELRAAGPTENRGIAGVKTLGLVPLAGEFPGIGERVLRVRELRFDPGAVVAVHQHDARPGVAYVLEGEMTEIRGEGAQVLTHGPGSTALEWTGVTHWWENRSGAPARALVVDIVPAAP
jgi:quercetin dioxygenase-like cupin family protein